MKQQKLPVWNSFDEFGLMVGLGHWTNDGKELRYVRYPGETNYELRERILNTYRHKCNATYQGLINSLSKDFLTPRYNTITQYYYTLTEEPYAQLSGIHVYTSGNTGWAELYPQVRASGYAATTSGWIVWNYPDVTGHYGQYTQILEILPSSLPVNDTPIKIEYQVLDYYDEKGVPTLYWKTDIDKQNIKDDDEYLYRVKKATVPDPSSQIVIHRLNSLATDGFSGVWYTTEGAATSKLKEVANYFNKRYPVEWGQIPWDTLTWENNANISQGTLPTLFDAELPVDQSGNIESGVFMGGVAQGDSLYLVDIVKEESGARSGALAYWYPRIYPGTFYVSNTGYYLFECKQSGLMTLTSNSGTLSFTNNPEHESMLIVGESGNAGLTGVYFSELYRHPYGSGVKFGTATGIFRRQYDLYSKINKAHSYVSGEYYIDMNTYFISGVDLPTRINLVWEHPDASGLGKIYSGYDLNPFMNDRESNILFIG